MTFYVVATVMSPEPFHVSVQVSFTLRVAVVAIFSLKNSPLSLLGEKVKTAGGPDQNSPLPQQFPLQ